MIKTGIKEMQPVKKRRWGAKKEDKLKDNTSDVIPVEQLLAEVGTPLESVTSPDVSVGMHEDIVIENPIPQYEAQQEPDYSAPYMERETPQAPDYLSQSVQSVAVQSYDAQSDQRTYSKFGSEKFSEWKDTCPMSDSILNSRLAKLDTPGSGASASSSILADIEWNKSVLDMFSDADTSDFVPSIVRETNASVSDYQLFSIDYSEQQATVLQNYQKDFEEDIASDLEMV